MNMRPLIKSFFRGKSTAGPSAAMVNHQLGSFNDFLPHADNSAPWMQRVVNNITVGADESMRGSIRLELGDLDVIVKLGLRGAGGIASRFHLDTVGLHVRAQVRPRVVHPALGAAVVVAILRCGERARYPQATQFVAQRTDARHPRLLLWRARLAVATTRAVAALPPLGTLRVAVACATAGDALLLVLADELLDNHVAHIVAGDCFTDALLDFGAVVNPDPVEPALEQSGGDAALVG
jgi:hypothetical protein